MAEPDPTFPPLLTGVAVDAQTDAYEKACLDAAAGKAEAGTVYWGRSHSIFSLAIVLEPEIDAARSMQMLVALTVAFGDAFGSIGPPEVGMFHRWPGDLVVNGARVGGMRAALPADAEPGDIPNWLVVGVTVTLTRDGLEGEPGEDLENTTFEDEGCGDITPTQLIESVSRHFLVWVHNWTDDGPKPLFDIWLPRAEGYNEVVTVHHEGREHTGQFVGIDDEGNMLLKPDGGDVVSLCLLDRIDRF